MLRLSQYQQIKTKKNGGMLFQMIQYISIINDLYIDQVEQWSTDKVISEFGKLKNKYKVSNKHSQSIELEGLQLNLIPFKYLTLGQFIDLEYFTTEGYYENMHKIASVIYLHQKKGGLYEDTFEKYGTINIDYRSERIAELPAQFTVGACESYLKFRKSFFESYDIFSDPFEDVDTEQMTDEEKQLFEQEKKIYEEKAGNQWTELINVLSNNDITKFDKVLSTNLFLSFNQLTYLHSQAKNQTK